MRSEGRSPRIPTECGPFADDSPRASGYPDRHHRRRFSSEQDESDFASVDRNCGRGRSGLSVRLRVPLHECVPAGKRVDAQDRAGCSDRWTRLTVGDADRRADRISGGRGTAGGDRQLSRRRRPCRSVGRDRVLVPHGTGTASAHRQGAGERPRIRRHPRSRRLHRHQLSRCRRCIRARSRAGRRYVAPDPHRRCRPGVGHRAAQDRRRGASADRTGRHQRGRGRRRRAGGGQSARRGPDRDAGHHQRDRAQGHEPDRKLHSDRRGDQSWQLGRRADRHRRASGGHQHRDSLAQRRIRRIWASPYRWTTFKPSL